MRGKGSVTCGTLPLSHVTYTYTHTLSRHFKGSKMLSHLKCRNFSCTKVTYISTKWVLRRIRTKARVAFYEEPQRHESSLAWSGFDLFANHFCSGPSGSVKPRSNRGAPDKGGKLPSGLLKNELIRSTDDQKKGRGGKSPCVLHYAG